MKIIQVQTQAEAAGAQRISDMVGNGLRASGHDILTVFMYRKTDIYDNDPHVIFISKTLPKSLLDEMKAAYKLIRYIKAEQPEVVISYQYWGNLFGTIGAKFAKASCIIANQSGAPMKKGLLGIVSRLDKIMGTMGWYHFNIVNSNWTEKQFEHYPSKYRAKLRHIEHGVFTSSQTYDKIEARNAFGLPPSEKIIISTGRITDDKNQMILIEVLALIPNIHLAIAGIGPAQEHLIQRAKELKVSDRLHFVGEILPEKIGQFLATGDIFAFPSLFETFGLAVVEAAASGVPVVANDLQTLKDVLQTDDGQAAALFASATDITAFSEAISCLLNDKTLTSRLSSAGRELSDKYAVEKMCNAYEKLLTPTKQRTSNKY